MSSDSPTCADLRLTAPDDWEVLPLQAVTDFQEGPGILAKDFHDAGIPLLRLRNIETPVVQLEGCNFLDDVKVAKKWSHFRLLAGDLLISTSASLGRVSVVGADAVGSVAYTGIIRFRSSSPQLNHKYLRAFLSSAAFVKQAEQMATGSVIKHFGPSHLRQMAITLPSLREQVQIAGIFDALDDRIALLRKTNATLEAIVLALFKSWFIDFDPVHAKQQGLAPEGMDESTGALFPDSFEESALGLLPKGWHVQTVGEAITVVDFVANGSFASLKENVTLRDAPSYALYVRTTDYNSGFSGDYRYVDKRAYDFLSKSSLSGSEVIISNVGDVGTVFRPPHWLGMPMTLGSNAVALKAPGLSSFLYFYFSGPKGQHDIQRIVTGSAQLKFNKTNFRSLKLAIPEPLVLERFESIAGELLAKIDSNLAAAKNLATLRDTLLPRLISGQLRLPEASSIS